MVACRPRPLPLAPHHFPVPVRVVSLRCSLRMRRISLREWFSIHGLLAGRASLILRKPERTLRLLPLSLSRGGMRVKCFQGFENRTSVIYLDDGNYLNEWIFSGGGSDVGQPGPLTRQKYLAHPSSSLAAYWPRIIYQGTSGEIREINYNCSSKTQCYYDKALSTTQARNGTQLLVLPAKSDLTSTAVFYQEQDGRFLEYREDGTGITTVLQNPAFSNLIPLDAPVAGFSTIRPTDAQNPNLNLYLLWQDSNNVIQLSYTDDTNVWKGPNTDPAFAGANNNTALSCLSGTTFPGFPQQRTTVLARCYFQTGMALREVTFNGNMWNITGVVPLNF
ncbi:hypothetical protein DM02DRAFT_171888 [Periconia macrospinosa]|uniref:Fucose-specific lectin n=1 Tax=Periconia macrospinosa TaxID=97972 RepID=A0A2V1DA22_9PLEO|nr:hypothetical protein DM02DRAFT_171888 [Periconia macrospinosa]